MGNLVVTISREYGCDGRIIGKKVASALGILYYDRALIQMTADKSGLSPEFIEQTEEKATSSFLYNIASMAYSNASTMYMQYDTPPNDKAFFAQSKVIQELAEKHSCVIVGRCSEYVLRDNPDCVKVFLYADKEDRIQKCMNTEGLDRKKAEAMIKKTDKGRANYHKLYTGISWKELGQYDLAINTSKSGVDGAVSTILSFIKSKK